MAMVNLITCIGVLVCAHLVAGECDAVPAVRCYLDIKNQAVTDYNAFCMDRHHCLVDHGCTEEDIGMYSLNLCREVYVTMNCQYEEFEAANICIYDVAGSCSALETCMRNVECQELRNMTTAVFCPEGRSTFCDDDTQEEYNECKARHAEDCSEIINCMRAYNCDLLSYQYQGDFPSYECEEEAIMVSMEMRLGSGGSGAVRVVTIPTMTFFMAVVVFSGFAFTWTD